MKLSIKILLLFAIVTQFSCVKDPFKEFEEGNWNNERSILGIRFENQVGSAEIVRDGDATGTIVVGINVDAVPDFSNIKLSSLVLSYEAASSVNVGQSLNFENESNSASITVTSPTGIERQYTVVAEPFTETILGTYTISNLVVWGGTGPEYGGGAVLAMTDKPWVWPENGGPSAELDNTITLELTGFTEDGNSYGTITNSAGADGAYADFQYVLDPATNVNGFYRKIPRGEGEWSRNYAAGMVTFTFPDGATTTGVFRESATTLDLGWDQTKTIESQAFEFSLNGTDDWDNIYSDYDKFVKRPRTFWIDLNRQ
ncbi:MAG: hypothetical protein RIC35_09315 [Marinoscillum sp.]